jgi:hypothetical protein
MWITVSEVEQKFLVPVLVESGVAIATYSLQARSLQTAESVKRYPELKHHCPETQAGAVYAVSIRAA